jgi:hypothetical protein
MEAFILRVLTENPRIIWVGAILFVGLFILAVAQNREFGLLGFKFGSKSATPQLQSPPAQSHQTVTVQNTFFNRAESAQEAKEKIEDRLEEIEKEAATASPLYVYQPPPVSHESVYFFAVLVMVEKHLTDLVWETVKISSDQIDDDKVFKGFDQSDDSLLATATICRRLKVIDQQLYDDINTFANIAKGVFLGSPPAPDEFKKHQYFAGYIWSRLDDTTPGIPQEIPF